MFSLIYSIQSSDGKVYGSWPLPASNRSSDVWASEIRGELGDILGLNDVKERTMPPLTPDANPIPWIVVDIVPSITHQAERLDRVHRTIARLVVAPEVQG